MTDTETIRQMVEAGETYTVEFKGEASKRLSDGDVVEAAVCLANGEGGHLLLGVEDDGRVTGSRPRHEAGHTDPDRVSAMIANRTQPPLQVRTESVELDGLPVLMIVVPKARTAVGTADGRYVRRAMQSDGSPGCVPFFAVEMLAGQVDRGVVDYAAMLLPEATWDDLDPLEIERLRRLVRANGTRADGVLASLSDVDIGRALGVVRGTPSEPELTAGALLLFGRPEALRRHVPTHEVAFQVLDGTSVSVNEIERFPLLRWADELGDRFRSRNTYEDVQLGLFRISVPAYPEESFREAVANALVHRDYTRLGAVHVQWGADSIQVSNPGGFPEGVALQTLLTALPHPRNPLLADAFKRVGLVERTGRGVKRIYEGQARFGRPLPNYQRTTRSDVVVVIPGGPANLAIARFVAERASEGHPLQFEELLVLNELVVQRSVTTSAAAVLLQTDETSARALLARMVEAGLLEHRGEHRSRSYHLAAGAYRAIGDKAAYVRARGFDPLQQEQMVLQYVEAHGSITRAQAADLCQLSPAQATRLLGRLVDQGRLLRLGERRGTRYALNA